MFKSLFGKKDNEEDNSNFNLPEDESIDVMNLTLQDLRVGYFVDYDQKTYEVKSKTTGVEDGEDKIEWKLESADDTIYLECYEDDELEWEVSRKIPLDFLNKEDLASFNEDQPLKNITLKGKKYTLTDEGTGELEDEEHYLFWTYSAENQTSVTIEQWDVNDFEASLSEEVSEHQFTNILPRM